VCNFEQTDPSPGTYAAGSPRCLNVLSIVRAGYAGGIQAEINIHFSGLRNLDRPGLLLFPNLVICLQCGFSRFTTPEAQLALLAMCSPKSDASTRKGDVRDVALGGSAAA
jgi:hypothetical protein